MERDGSKLLHNFMQGRPALHCRKTVDVVWLHWYVMAMMLLWSMLSKSAAAVAYSKTLRVTNRLLSKNIQRNVAKVKPSTLLFSATGISFEESTTSNVRNTPRKFVNFPFEYHEEIELQIEDLSNLGVGVGKYLLPDGQKWVVMVPTALPGEIVKCKIYKNHNSYSDADLIEVKFPSAGRISPPCPYYQVCGGCQYQHMTIDSQRSWKKRQVETLLERIGEFDPSSFNVGTVIGSHHEYGYRTKITPHYDPPKSPEELQIGFLRRGTRSIVNIDKCIIASDAINDRYKKMRQEILDSIRKKQVKRGATLLLREGDNGNVTSNHNDMIRQTVKDIVFEFKAGEFFQNNPHVLPLMLEYVIGEAKGLNSDCDTLVDTYCGSGLFSLCGASSFKNIFGVEVSALAIEAANANMKRNNISNVEYLCGHSERIFETINGRIDPKRTVVIIDPPRKGCDESFLNQLFAFAPKRLVYVSCDPATQARDAKSIVAADYSMQKITPFDLFPQTRHIENVITFERNL